MFIAKMWAIYLFIVSFDFTEAAMTLKQLEQSLAMFRKACADRLEVDLAEIQALHRGVWPDDNKKLKCFTMCVAQNFGTLTKKNEISEAKMRRQIETIVPVSMRDYALGALEACKDVQKNYKDPCDKSYYSTKCIYDYDPKNFMYP